MLGHKLYQVLSETFDVWALVRRPIADSRAKALIPAEKTLVISEMICGDGLRAAFEELRPEVIINSAGIIKQSSASARLSDLIQVNSVLPHKIAEIAEQIRARVINISTDCVFSGSKGKYKESDTPDATDIYGRSKLLGELSCGHCLTIRTSVIGRELGTQNSLVEWFLANRDGTVNGYANAIYSGMPTIIFAGIISELILRKVPLSGVYHLASTPISKFQLLQMLNDAYGSNVKILPTDEPRIDRSLDGSRFVEATGITVPNWDEMIRRMVNDNFIYQ
jgi:dTDP-4-dehydrorhamnose reductase